MRCRTLFLESRPGQALEQSSSKVAEDVVHTLQPCFQGTPHFVSGTPHCRCTITCNILDKPFPAREQCFHFFSHGLTKVVDRELGLHDLPQKKITLDNFFCYTHLPKKKLHELQHTPPRWGMWFGGGWDGSTKKCHNYLTPAGGAEYGQSTLSPPTPFCSQRFGFMEGLLTANDRQLHAT